jgi:flagellar biosynthesis chaperone FliJ
LAEALEAEAVLDAQHAQFMGQAAQLVEVRCEAAAPQTFDLNRLVDAQRYELVLAAERSALDSQRKALACEVANRRAALVHADGEVRVAERLEQKLAAVERQHQDRLDNRELDEVALLLFNRRRRQD